MERKMEREAQMAWHLPALCPFFSLVEIYGVGRQFSQP